MQNLSNYEKNNKDFLDAAENISITLNLEELYANSTREQIKKIIDDVRKPKQPLLDYKKCQKCKVTGMLDGSNFVCGKCGQTWEHKEEYFSVNDTSHNTSDSTFISFKIIGGRGSYRLNRNLLKHSANYPTYRKNNNRREIANIIFSYNGPKIPKTTRNKGIELYDKIKRSGLVFRGQGNLGVIGSCLSYACYMDGIMKTPKHIANMLNIDEKHISNGERILASLNQKGIIDIPILMDTRKQYVTQYFTVLKIPTKYKQFVLDLLDRAEAKKIHIMFPCRDTSMCVGAIYMLTQRVRELSNITKDKIAQSCSKSRSTFMRYYQVLMQNYKKIKKVFKIHKIPMPNDWQEKDTSRNVSQQHTSCQKHNMSHTDPV